MKTKIVIELTDEQWELLCYTLGAATGQELKDNHRELADKIYQLLNHCMGSQKRPGEAG